MSTWQAGQGASNVPSFPAGPGPWEVLLVLGQWALEKGCGGHKVPTENKEPSVGSRLLGSDQLQLPHWQEGWGGWGGHVPLARKAPHAPGQLLVPQATA